jgi:hypothetical protein
MPNLSSLIKSIRDPDENVGTRRPYLSGDGQRIEQLA